MHFIEKTVPLYELAKMASIKNLKDYIEVHDFVEEKIGSEQNEDFTDYLHRKMPCQLKIDTKKRQYYDDTCGTNPDVKTGAVLHPLASSTEFIFDEIFPDGKLSIPQTDRDDNEDIQDARVNDIFSKESRSPLSKYHEAYNVNLTNTEETAMSKKLRLEKKQKRKPLRGEDGKFIKQNNISLKHIDIDDSSGDHCTMQTETIQYIHTHAVEKFEMESILPDIPDNIYNSSSISMSDDFCNVETGHNDQSENCSKIFDVSVDKSFRTLDGKADNTLRLFRPFKDYWMYRCTFSRVKSKNFELFEKTLPRSFRWLLNECASVVEMSTEDLYEEVCLVEAYYANVSEQREVCTNGNAENRNQAYFNAVLKIW